MSLTHLEACAQSERLERTSDDNLVDFFAKDLQRINKGEKATSLLNDSVIKNLVRFGILKHAILKGRGVRVLILTDKAHDLLESR